MIERQNLIIHLFDKGVNNKLIPENLNEFIKFIHDELDLVPNEFKDSAKIQFESEDEYSTRMVITFERPETDDEINMRLRCTEEIIKSNEIKEKERFKKLLETNPSFFDEFKTMFEKDNH